MPDLRVEKTLSSLPGTLTADTVYAVRVGVGFDLYVSDSTGLIAHKVNDGAESNPVFTYDPLSGNVTQITYGSTNTKNFQYINGKVSIIDYVVGAVTYRKTFNYDITGNLVSIVQTQF